LNKAANSFLTDACLLVLGSAVAYALAVLAKSAVMVDGAFLPYGNDAFYHAHRVLEALNSGAGIQEFDPQMHVPEGSWLTWPWGFDYLLVMLVQFVGWFSTGADPMRTLIYVPVAWIPVNVFLLLGICKALDLRIEFRALAVLGLALLPLTQRLHGIGAIDHHFMELTFVLLVILLLLRWMQQPSNLGRAIACGAALGFAQMFHHGLFVLQLPMLLTLFILWLRGSFPSAAAVNAVALAVFASTLLIALPSGPLLDGQFSMATLSLFHLYVVFATSIMLLLMSFTVCSRWALCLLVVVAVSLAVPVISEVLYGTQFIAGELGMLNQIVEMQSPLSMISGGWGLQATLAQYSGLLLLVPLLLLAGLYIALTESQPLSVAYGVMSVFGLALLMMQLRLNYFGVCFLLTGPFYFLSRYAPAASSKRIWVLLGSVVVFVLVFRSPLSSVLFRQHSLAGDHLYEVTQPLYPVLMAACADETATVAASPQFGHYIRFHTDCSVIANNFLLTEQHFEKVQLVNSLFHLSVTQLAAEQPEVRYVLGFLANTYEQRDGKVFLRDMSDIRSKNPLLINELMLPEQPRTDVEVLYEVYVDPHAEQKIPLAGIYKIKLRP
jgi:asparagine N-glycosylation enzyme membrane subunit Stt3